MRQAGVLAAAALVAIEEGPKRLHVDHENAQLLARGLAEIPRVKIEPKRVQTNIIICDVGESGLSSSDFLRRLAERKVLAGPVDVNRVRMVTHLDVDRSDIEQALSAVRQILGTTG